MATFGHFQTENLDKIWPNLGFSAENIHFHPNIQTSAKMEKPRFGESLISIVGSTDWLRLPSRLSLPCCQTCFVGIPKKRRILLQSSEIKHSCVFLPTLFRKWESFQSCFINLGLTFKGYLNLLKERTEGRVSAGSTLHSLSDAAHAFDPVSLLLGNFPFSFF